MTHSFTVRWLCPREAAWDGLVERAVCTDFYYSRRYHSLEAKRLKSDAELLFIGRRDYFVGLPMLWRPLSDIIGYSGAGKVDASCVNGYGGPIFNRVDIPAGLIRDFQELLKEELMRRGVVSLFARLHPMFDQRKICNSLGHVLQAGETISVDLASPEGEQLRQMRLNLRRNYKKGERHGLVVREDETWSRLPEFVKTYNDTMNRVGAGEEYRFNGKYFEDLRSALGVRARLVLCLSGDDVIAGAVFVQTKGIIQYHLAGTCTRSIKISPMSFLIVEAMRLFRGQALILHLGGGVGGNRDGLFHFKAGFSHRRHAFLVWRWVIDQESYQRACQVRGEAASSIYFPPYRAP